MSLGERLHELTSGCKLEVHSIETDRKLTDEQRKLVTQLFRAEDGAVKGSRAVINRKHPQIAEVNRIVRAARSYWKAFTVPYEAGLRLIRTDRIQSMRDAINALHADLEDALDELDEAWESVKEDAKDRLADLYCEADYSVSPSSVVGFSLSFPSVGPDMRLQQLHPEIYEEETRKLQAKFAEAAETAQKAIVAELQEMVSGLSERISAKESEDGKKKVIQQRAIDQIVAFAERFEAVKLGGETELSSLVGELRALAGNTNVSGWKSDADNKVAFADGIKAIGEKLNTMIADAGVRTIEF